jgi:hypothetical protein
MTKRKSKGAYMISAVAEMLSRFAGPFDALAFGSVAQGRLRTSAAGARRACPELVEGRNPEQSEGSL